MGIDRIKLGPRSRVVQAQERAAAEAAEREYLERAEGVLNATMSSPAMKAKLEKARTDLLVTGRSELEVTEDDIVSPPLPGPVNPHAPTSIRSCGCGRWHLPSSSSEILDPVYMVLHRYSKACRPARGAATPEPPPQRGQRVVLDDLVAMLRERSDFGLRKYGTRLETFNGRDAHLDALQELLDLFVYLHQAQMEKAELERENAALRTRLAEAGVAP